MPSEWAAVESLIRELGAVRAAAFAAHADTLARGAIETAIAEATDAVLATLSRPVDSRALSHARDAIEVAIDVLVEVDAELERSLRVRSRGSALRQRSLELIAEAHRMRGRQG